MKLKRQPRKPEPLPVSRWAARLGVSLMSMRFALDSRPQFERLKGATVLGEVDARAVAAVAKTIQM